jgi:hypothetical protein
MKAEAHMLVFVGVARKKNTTYQTMMGGVGIATNDNMQIL